ncbi:MAG TPA: DUF559 domain-containing protein [Acidimicrobiia bacterium]|nr:DUF559 domain-containing protein [Acidimicrobiia bacterium]
MNSIEVSVLARAEQQYGVVTREHVLACGFSVPQLDRRVGSRRLLPVFPGVYRVAGAPVTDRQRALAACLWLGPTAVVSHLSAATLLRLDGCATTELVLSVPRSVRRRVTAPGLVVHRVAPLARVDRVRADGIPCTSATRTIVDCAAVLDDEALEVAFEAARRMGLTSARALEARAEALCGSGRPGSASVRALLARQQPGEHPLHYRLEVKTARLLRTSGLPRPERQVPAGRYRIDFGFVAERVGIECEGYEYHGSRLAWKRDKRRSAWLESRGWRLVFVTWEDVTERPNETLDRIALALGARAA